MTVSHNYSPHALSFVRVVMKLGVMSLSQSLRNIYFSEDWSHWSCKTHLVTEPIMTESPFPFSVSVANDGGIVSSLTEVRIVGKGYED